MNKRKVMIGGIVILLLGGGAWAFGFFHRTDPAIAELHQLGSQAFDKNLPDAQRDQLRQEFRQKMGDLSDDQRRAFFDANRGQWEARAQQRMDDYFKMTKAEQQKQLDEMLDRIVKARNSQQQKANANPQSQSGGRGDANRGGRGTMTEAKREERSKDRLDRSTPKMRAQMVEYRKQLDTRAQQRGISLGDPGRGGGFGYGFGRGPRGA
jgi:uncharacterized membrane protein